MRRDATDCGDPPESPATLLMAETIRIARLAAGGDGVGRLADGRAVFVPRTAPGDLVRLDAVRLHRRYARASVAQVLEPGPDRVEPICAHYEPDACGGCQLQHVALPAQLRAKRAIVGDALRRLAGRDAEDPEIEPPTSAWAYRAKLTLSVGDGGAIGLHRLERPGEVFELRRCEITASPLMRLWEGLRAHRALLPEALERLVLRMDRSGGVHLIARGSGGWTKARPLGRALAAAGLEAVVWWEPEGGAARVLAGGDDPYPATVFEQVHPAMGDAVRAYAVAAAGDLRGRHAWDLYAGIGETTARLRALGATVESVEVDGRAVRFAERWAGPGDGVQRHAGRVEDLLGPGRGGGRARLRRPAVVVTNPPRVGMAPGATAGILAAEPERVVYVSCDPATLARDLTRLGSRYRLASVRAFDLFPQTAHVEAVAVLERA